MDISKKLFVRFYLIIFKILLKFFEVTGQNTCLISTNIISSLKSETKPIEFEIQNEAESKAILPTEEKNITVDDSFYDQKEELFSNNLPPEVMGGTPEFQIYDELLTIREDENIVQNMKSNIEVKYTNSASNNSSNPSKNKLY